MNADTGTNRRPGTVAYSWTDDSKANTNRGTDTNSTQTNKRHRNRDIYKDKLKANTHMDAVSVLCLDRL